MHDWKALAETTRDACHDGCVYDHFDLRDKFAEALESAYELGRHEVLSAITYVGPDGGVHNSFHDYVDLRTVLS